MRSSHQPVQRECSIVESPVSAWSALLATPTRHEPLHPAILLGPTGRLGGPLPRPVPGPEFPLVPLVVETAAGPSRKEEGRKLGRWRCRRGRRAPAGSRRQISICVYCVYPRHWTARQGWVEGGEGANSAGKTRGVRPCEPGRSIRSLQDGREFTRQESSRNGPYSAKTVQQS